MTGFHDPAWVSAEDREAVTRLRRRVLDDYGYRDVMPERGLSIDGRPALTGIDPTKVGKYVVLSVRDPLGGHEGPGHAHRLASRFGPAEEVGSTGLFQTATAPLGGGESVTVVATGSGSPDLELALVELLEHTDAEVLVYFGAAAGLHPFLHPGDVVVSTGVVREEGMTRAYVESHYPAATSYDVVAAFLGAAQDAGASVHAGVTRSTDSDILGNGRPSIGGYLQPRHAEVVDYWVRAGVLSNDREASAVVTLGSLFGRRTGVVLGCTDTYPSGRTLAVGAGIEDATTTLVDGLRRLQRMDAAREESGARYWAPQV
ncbi:MAG: uridine phosphorylase [Nocardioides sp.]|nr:uridine phosphorylase [Nocardioides sp.]